MAKQRVVCIIVLLLVFVLGSMITSANARVYRDYLPTKLDTIDIYRVFKELGYDESKLEYFRRRSMVEDQRDRVAPGGPAAQHH
uniref:Uncharacterized protein n=1 Tax=Chenopodium quinoa TaxID=63459 RepID=A0A803LVQ0_CHEQI